MSSQATDVQEPQVIDQQTPLSTFPTTAEGLRLFCVWAFNDLLQNPANASVLSSVVVNGLATALKNDQQRLQRDMMRPVLVKDYFEGSVRATTIVAEGEHGQQLGVTLEIQHYQTKAWGPLPVEEDKQEFLKKLVLARATIPSEVWFITTSKALEDAATKGAEVLAAAHGV